MRKLLLFLVGGAVLQGTTGCGVGNLLPGRTFQQQSGWRAEDYFTDPKVIALCNAIENNDLPEMKQLVTAGADVNAQGKHGMTPLLWAFPDNHLSRFKWLLEHGANPNVVIRDEIKAHRTIHRGDSVTQMVCRTSFPGYFEAVFDNGGDPNIRRSGPGYSDTPLHTVIQAPVPERLAKVQRLIELGADMNALALGTTPVGMAVGWGGQFDLALVMLRAGANFRTYEENKVQRLIHMVVRQERRLHEYSPEKQAQFHELVKWLEDHGESYEEAKADLARWDSWSRTTGEFRQKMDAEIAERTAREKAAADPPHNQPRHAEPGVGADSR